MSDLRKRFDKNREIDRARRAELVPKLKRMKVSGQEAGAPMVHFAALYAERKGSEEIKSALGSARSRVLIDASRLSWCQTSVQVRANLEEVAAVLWDFDSQSNFEFSGDVERKVETDSCDGVNNRGYFEATIERRQKLKSKNFEQHRDRQFTSKFEMHRVDEDIIVLLITPTTVTTTAPGDRHRTSGLQHARGVVKGKETVAIRLTGIKEGLTRLDLAAELNLGRGVSHDAKLEIAKQRLDEAGRVSVYFQRLVLLDALAGEDGKALAEDLLFGTSSSKQRLDRLPEVMAKNAALKELKARYECAEPLIRRFLSGSLGLSRAIGTKLVCLSEKEGKQLGKNGVAAVKSKKLADAGIDQWKRQVS